MRGGILLPTIISVWIAVASLLVPGGADASGAEAKPSPPPLTLRDAVDQALRNNPLALAARSGRQMADAQVREARGGWLPRFSFTETYTRSNNPVFVFGSLLEQGRFGPSNFAIDALNDPAPLNNFRTALNVRVPLFDQLQTYTGSIQARIGQEQAASQQDLAEQQLRFEVIRTYYGVLVAQARNEVADEAVKMAEADVKRAKDLFETGVVVQSDLLSAQVQLSEFRQQAIQSAGEVTTSLAALNAALDLPVVTAHRVTGELSEKSFELPGQAKLLALALAKRPDYAQAVASVHSAEAGARRAEARYLPRLDAFGTYGGSAHTLGIDSSDYTLGATLTVDLFDGSRRGRLGKARAAVSLAQAERKQTANQVRLGVVRAYQQYLSARQRLSVASGAVEQAREALRIVRDRYQEGITTITEVLRAETAVVRARMNRLAARYENYLGYANVLLATGTLNGVEPFES